MAGKKSRSAKIVIVQQIQVINYNIS